MMDKHVDDDGTSVEAIPEFGEAITPPATFPFPFQPYDIQDGFMRNLFEAINNRKIGIFESPTGTGKSLSIICGALTWLKEYKQDMERRLRKIQEEERKMTKKSSTGSTDWLAAEYESTKAKEVLRLQRKKIEEGLVRELQWKKRREKLAAKRKGKDKDEVDNSMDEISSVLKEAKQGFGSDLPDSDLILEEYEEEETSAGKKGGHTEAVDHVMKIYYCTRTHSQVTQFIHELKKSPFGSSTRVSALASRQNLCVFEPVKQLRSVRAMNDRCIELQKGTSKKKVVDPQSGTKKRTKKDPNAVSSCPYYEKTHIENLSTQILDKVLDIEESAKAGINHIACPYYASRSAVPDAEVVAVPYNLILHRPTREASGIILDNQVVIIDEAHNLLEAVVNMYSTEITLRQTSKALSQLQQYHDRYRTRLTPKNLLYIKQLLVVLTRLKDVWSSDGKNNENKTDKQNSTENKNLRNIPDKFGNKNIQNKTEVKTIDKFLTEAELETINLFKVLAYCKKSLIARKLMSFAERYPEGMEASVDESASMGSPLMVIEGFLETLTNTNKDGRVIVDKSANGKLRFLLLNPAVCIKDILQSARCVILAGGTMQPISDFEDQLLKMSGIPLARLHKFSCGHVISPENILPIALGKGPSGSTFEFNFENRGNSDMVLQFGRLLVNLTNVIPGGMVCFFPSYDFEEHIFTAFSKTSDIAKNIEKKKTIFREPKKSSDADAVLKAYSQAIRGPKTEGRTGAMIFSVVGGKLSEGINFSDDLGRCVVMVGLPFPNMYSVELQEKMNFLNANLPRAPSPDGRLPGKVHYDNLCMKAVNQSIGRAIRHKDDYAVILLVDVRYAQTQINRQLPSWIGERLQISPNFPDAFGKIRQFFTTKTL